LGPASVHFLQKT